MTDGFALKSWVISLVNKVTKKSNGYYKGKPIKYSVNSNYMGKRSIPIMTADEDDYGKLTASSSYQGSDYALYDAFSAKRQGWLPSYKNVGEWLMYESKSIIKFNQIWLEYFEGDGCTIDIEISDNGTDFTKIDTTPRLASWTVIKRNYTETYTCKYIRFKLATTTVNKTEGYGYKFWVMDLDEADEYEMPALIPIIHDEQQVQPFIR